MTVGEDGAEDDGDEEPKKKSEPRKRGRRRQRKVSTTRLPQRSAKDPSPVAEAAPANRGRRGRFPHQGVAAGRLSNSFFASTRRGNLSAAAALPHPPIRIRATSLMSTTSFRSQARPHSSSRPKRSSEQTPAPPAAPAGVTPRTIQNAKPIQGNLLNARRRLTT
ncbi:hypothetical protein DIPPA_09742 [Diplonema papillatum]|nr:hypothetical protein DIPPA_09742 [Diplonema papillatum]